MNFELFDPAVARALVGLVAAVALIGLAGIVTLSVPAVRSVARHRTIRRSRHQSLRTYNSHLTHAH